MEALINLVNKINIMNLDFVKKLGLWILETKVDTQKIDGSKLNTFEMVIASFLVEDKE